MAIDEFETFKLLRPERAQKAEIASRKMLMSPTRTHLPPIGLDGLSAKDVAAARHFQRKRR